ncbi:MAG TPA: ABC transporter permease [Thermoanaerobaculia bacterium]|nr:ABC transporter permease [Thermoanaerobaculia bacterium]
MRNVERLVLPVLFAGVLVAMWHFAVVLTATAVFPSPADVFRGIVTLAERGTLWSYIGDSLLRVGVGYIAAVLSGVPAGLWLGWHPGLARALNPVIQMLRPISPLAWMPLAIIWFGVSNAAPIFLIFLASFLPIVVSMMNAVQNVPQAYLQAARNFGLSTPQMIRRVIFPAVLPRAIVALRIAFGIAWIVLVASEMIAVDSGLGYLIIDARNAGMRYDLVVGGMLLIGVIGLFLDVAIRSAERLPSVRWGFRE